MPARLAYNVGMHWLRAVVSILRGTLDRDSYAEYHDRLLAWANQRHGLTREEFRAAFEGRYLDPTGRDLFLEYLLAVSKQAPSYLTDHPAMLADRVNLHRRFGLPILTMRELRDQENERLARLDSPLRL